MKQNELRAEMARKGISMNEAQKALKISPTALRRKMKSETEFKASEIKTLMKLLELDLFLVERIFLD